MTIVPPVTVLRAELYQHNNCFKLIFMLFNILTVTCMFFN
jgi:hypothetical protein